MNTAKCTEEDYINFLIATPQSYSCVEAAKVQPEAARPVAHDAFTRLLQRLEPDSEQLWRETEPYVQKRTGVLVLDDSTLDKPYARQMALVSYHWSGKHHRVVKGMNLLTLLWTEGESYLPCDYRLYDKAQDGLGKHEHFRALLQVAHTRGFAPECVLFDSWYSSLENLKHIRDLGWTWLTQLKSNRIINPDGTGQRPLAEVALSAAGSIVYLKGYGLIKLFLIVASDGSKEYWATNDLQMSELTRLRLAENAWAIETYHRGIKQFCGIERAQVRSARAQRNHVGLALRAFLRLERHCFVAGRSWFEAKADIIRAAVKHYLAHPLYTLPRPTA
jgi:putative transposase